MVRIKGANSDYVFDLGTGQIQEQPQDQPVYLKIFICPNDMPSQVEKPYQEKAGNWCQGTDADCPQSQQKEGHALIHLHQTEGISLVTQNTIAAKGTFVVQPQGEPRFQVGATEVTAMVPLVVQSQGKQPILKVTETELTVTAPLVLKTQEDKGFQVSISHQELTLQAPNGATIHIEGNNIEITPGKMGTVKINGNLEVTGEVTVAGQKLSTS